MAILTKLKFEVFLTGEYIIRQGTIGNKMYFVQRGTVAVLDNDNQIKTRLGKGSHFGEICLLSESRRTASIRTETICDLFSLSKQHLQSILKEYPDMQGALEAIALNRLMKVTVGTSRQDVQHKGNLSVSVSPPAIAKGPNDTLEENVSKRQK